MSVKVVRDESGQIIAVAPCVTEAPMNGRDWRGAVAASDAQHAIEGEEALEAHRALREYAPPRRYSPVEPVEDAARRELAEIRRERAELAKLRAELAAQKGGGQ